MKETVVLTTTPCRKAWAVCVRVCVYGVLQLIVLMVSSPHRLPGLLGSPLRARAATSQLTPADTISCICAQITSPRPVLPQGSPQPNVTPVSSFLVAELPLLPPKSVRTWSTLLCNSVNLLLCNSVSNR